MDSVNAEPCFKIQNKKAFRGHHCFAKAVHSRAKLRTANSLLLIRPFIQCLIRHPMSIALEHNKKCVLSQVKRYSYVLPLRNKLSTEDRSFSSMNVKEVIGKGKRNP